MAAVAIPVLTALAPSILELITSLVHRGAPAQEAALGAKTGPVKFANLFASVMQDLINAHAAGQIAGDLPTTDLVKFVMQIVITSLKLQGVLGSTAVDDAVTVPVPTVAVTPTPAAPAAAVAVKPNSQSFALAGGGTLTFSVA